MSTAREAILRYFREPPPLTPEDLGIVFTAEGKAFFLDASEIVEITPALPVSALPRTPHGVAFWRGRAIEVRGESSRAHSLLLLRGDPQDFFVVADARPRAVSRAEVPEIPFYRERHGRR